MVTAFMNNKGFTVFELLIILIIATIISLLTVSNGKVLNMDHLYFMNEYLLKQSASLSEYKPSSYEYDVHFNSMGRVRNARTINFGNRKVIIHLGNGYLSHE